MRHFNKNLASVVVKDGYLQVVTPGGYVFPAITSSSVDCRVCEDATVTLTADVNVVSTVEEAKRLYGANDINLKIKGDDLQKVINRQWPADTTE